MQFICRKNETRINIQINRAKDSGARWVHNFFTGFPGTIKLDVYVKRIMLPDRRNGNGKRGMNRVNIRIGSNSFGIFGQSSLRSCNRWWYYNHSTNRIIPEPGIPERASHKMHPFKHFLRTCLKMKADDPNLECIFEGFQGEKYDDPKAVDEYLKLFF